MELALVLLVVAILAWFTGFLAALRRLSRTANRAVADIDNSHKTKMAKKLAALELSEEEMTKALTNKALLDSFDL